MSGMHKLPRHIVFLLGTLLTTSLACGAAAQSAQEKEVLAPIQAMFAGMSKRDAAAIKTPTLPGGTMVLR